MKKHHFKQNDCLHIENINESIDKPTVKSLSKRLNKTKTLFL